MFKNIGVNFLKDAETPKTTHQFDSAAGVAATKIADDSLETQAIVSEIQALRKQGLYATLQLSDDVLENDIGEDELASDRLDAYVLASEDDGDEVDEHTAQIISANMADAFATFGVSEDVINSIFSDDPDEADAAIQTAAEIVAQNVPTTDDDLADFATAFIFGDETTGVFDAAVGKTTVKKNAMGQKIVYKAVKAIRNGKVSIVNKRVNKNMTVRKTAKQKAAIKKMQIKAMTGSALKKRVRSLAKHNRLNLS